MERTLLIVTVVVVSIVFLVMIFVLGGESRGKTGDTNVINIETRTEVSIPKTNTTSAIHTPSETHIQTPTTTLTVICRPLFYVGNLFFNDHDFTVEIVLKANIEPGCVVYVNRVVLVDLDSGFNLTLLDENPLSIGGGQAQFVPLTSFQLSETQYLDLKNNYNKENYRLIIIYVVQRIGIEETVSIPLRPRELSPIL